MILKILKNLYLSILIKRKGTLINKKIAIKFALKYFEKLNFKSLIVEIKKTKHISKFC